MAGVLYTLLTYSFTVPPPSARGARKDNSRYRVALLQGGLPPFGNCWFDPNSIQGPAQLMSPLRDILNRTGGGRAGESGQDTTSRRKDIPVADGASVRVKNERSSGYAIVESCIGKHPCSRSTECRPGH
jgi:hypothetical protein